MIANRRTGLVAASLVTLALLPTPVRALGPTRTFELRIFPYCKPGTFCGTYASFEELEKALFKAVEEVNLQWAHTGISFRPNVQPVDGTSPSGVVSHCDDGVESADLGEHENDLCTTSADCPTDFTCKALPAGTRYWMVGQGCANDEIGGVMRKHWRVNVRDTIADAIPVFVLEGVESGVCCGGGVGVYCNPRSGTIWAHEIGHVFCGPHTFQGEILDDDGNEVGRQYRFPDPPEYPAGTVHHDGDGLADTPPDPGPFEKLAKVCALKSNGAKTVVKCSTDADCENQLGLNYGCNLCTDRVCSLNDTINCDEQSDCQDALAGDCVCNPHMDEDFDGNPREGHVWCDTTVQTDVDAGSPHLSRCDIDCKELSGGVEVTLPGPWPKPHVAMSYYSGDNCRGPYVHQGLRYDIFTLDGQERIFDCIEEDYAALVDVCAGQDLDHDGVCDADDTCPTVPNLSTQEKDGDGDGVPDRCDNCPKDPNPDQADNEHDGDGDVCDTDDDNDDCYDTNDQHPTSPLARAGSWIFSPTCSGDLDGTLLLSEANLFDDDTDDPDMDGLPFCKDYDDDNDGLCDDDEVLSGSENAPNYKPGVPPGGCVGPDPCPLCDEANDPDCFATCHPFQDCPIAALWDVCAFGPGCLEYFLKLVRVVNPDPTTDLRFERFEIAGEVIFAGSLAGLTPSESATAMQKLAGAAGALALTSGEVTVASEERVSLEIWRHATRTEPERFVAQVGEYDADRITIGPIGRGHLVRIVPTRDRDTAIDSLYVDTDYTVGLPAGMRLADADADTWPDFFDNCPDTSNPEQFDDDRDRFGNACDADLDNDCELTQADVDRVRACSGADMNREPDLDEDPDRHGEDLHVAPAASVANVLHEICRIADLDEDDLVDDADADVARALLGTRMDAGCVPGAVAPFEGAGCIRSRPFSTADLRVRNLNRPPGKHLVSLRARLLLDAPITPPLDPETTGIHVLLRTSTGRSLIDVSIPPGAYAKALAAGWTSTATSASWVSREGVGGVTSVLLAWDGTRPAGAVDIEVEAKRGDLGIAPSELPLFAEVVLDDLRAATEHCGETDFGSVGGGPTCAMNRTGSEVVCR